ncbi:Orf5 [Heliothis zea nudivirus]|uniref:Orf5 n=1 Tax=Heliothis zea nudivirus 1 TaxID=3116536 RepID=Q8JKV5_9VIRU|nr:Orf5 [Heliothis zea nudivirus]AAN04303.1 Orf5 [Heliothis zea nudivirus]
MHCSFIIVVTIIIANYSNAPLCCCTYRGTSVTNLCISYHAYCGNPLICPLLLLLLEPYTCMKYFDYQYTGTY